MEKLSSFYLTMNYPYTWGIFFFFKSTLCDSIKKFSKFEAKSTKSVQVMGTQKKIDFP